MKLLRSPWEEVAWLNISLDAQAEISWVSLRISLLRGDCRDAVDSEEVVESSAPVLD